MKNNIQKYLFWILLVFLAVGMIYPVIGLLAIICMLAPVIMAPYKGRYGVVIFVREVVFTII